MPLAEVKPQSSVREPPSRERVRRPLGKLIERVLKGHVGLVPHERAIAAPDEALGADVLQK